MLYIPLRLYVHTDYSHEIFVIKPTRYFFSCRDFDHGGVYLGENALPIQKSSVTEDFQNAYSFLLSDHHTEEHFEYFRNLIINNNIDYVIIDISDNRMEEEKFLEHLIKYKKPVLYEGNIFIFSFR